MSSQLFAAARKEASIEKALDAGDYMPLKSWLNDNVQILTAAMGTDLSAESYVADLTRKVAELTA